MVIRKEKENLQEIVEAVRNLVKSEKNLVCSTDDEFLIRFIKAGGYNVRQSFQTLRSYFRSRVEFPNVFIYGTVAEHEPVIRRLDLGYILNAVDYGGRRICLLKFGDLDPAREDFDYLMRSAVLLVEALSLEPEIQETGVTLIIDCTNFSLKIMKWATPYKLRATMTYLQESVPVRFDRIHMVNTPLVFNIFYSALKPFMKESFLEKIMWHKAPFNKLHSSMSSDYLPPWLGGTLDLEEIKDWYKDIIYKQSALTELSQMGYLKSPE